MLGKRKKDCCEDPPEVAKPSSRFDVAGIIADKRYFDACEWQPWRKELTELPAPQPVMSSFTSGHSTTIYSRWVDPDAFAPSRFIASDIDPVYTPPGQDCAPQDTKTREEEAKRRGARPLPKFNWNQADARRWRRRQWAYQARTLPFPYKRLDQMDPPEKWQELIGKYHYSPNRGACRLLAAYAQNPGF